MRRYTPLFLVAFIFMVLLFAGNTYLAGYADQNDKKNMKAITVYTTLPVEHIAVLAEEYEKVHQVRARFVPLTGEELLNRVEEESTSGSGRTDVVLADRAVLAEAARRGFFTTYISEQTDIVAQQFKDGRDAWVGVWYDPMVLCANLDYLKSLPILPSSWADLAKLSNVRVAITDFYAADASANLLYTLIAEYDEQRAFDLLRKIHPNVLQYAKYLATPVRMTGMGEADIAVAVYSEVVRYTSEGFPVVPIYPSEGTSYMLTGVGLIKNSENHAEAKQFIHWLLSDEAQMCLQKNRFFFIPTNQETLAYKSFGGRNLRLFENYSDLSQLQKRAVLDRWIKNIRLK